MNIHDESRWTPNDGPGYGGRSRRRGRGGWGEGFGSEPSDEYFADGPRPPRPPRPPRGGWWGMGPMGFGPADFGWQPGRHRGGRVRRGDVRLAILALLAEQPANGYQVIQALAERTDGAWKPSPGAVYPALSQLEDEALIEPFDNAGQKAFRLTEAGQREASEIDPKPWEQVNQDYSAPEGVGAMWQEFGGVAKAAKAVMDSGSAQHLSAAAEVLADTKRRLYGLLAEDDV